MRHARGGRVVEPVEGSRLELVVLRELDAAGKRHTVEGQHLLMVTRLLAAWPTTEGMAALSAEHTRLCDKVLPNRAPRGTGRGLRPVPNNDTTGDLDK